MFRWEVIKSFALRSMVSGAVAVFVYAGGHVVDLGTSADNAALVSLGITSMIHFIHALAAKYGVDVPMDGSV